MQQTAREDGHQAFNGSFHDRVMELMPFGMEAVVGVLYRDDFEFLDRTQFQGTLCIEAVETFGEKVGEEIA
jgi:hypothetical protein